MPHNTTNLRTVGSPTSAADAPELENMQTQDPSDVDIDDMVSLVYTLHSLYTDGYIYRSWRYLLASAALNNKNLLSPLFRGTSPHISRIP